MSASPQPHDALLRVQGLTKAFPGTLALDNVDLALHSGTVTALAGHNGSGKSTIVKVLAGVYKADAGHASLLSSDGATTGIHFIHQDLGLAENLTTVENLGLRLGEGWRGYLSPRASNERAEAERLLRRLGVTLDVTARLARLTPAQRTMVAIARATAHWENPRQVLVLDEPTASLQDREAQVVLDMTRRIADAGAAVLFISHRLEEVTQLADEVVVLRDGRIAAQRGRGNFDADLLVDFIAGHAPSREEAQRSSKPSVSEDRLVVTELRNHALRGVDLSVRAGEIVGVSGVIGSGIDHLLPCIFGSTRADGGEVRINGRRISPGSTRDAIGAGAGLVPRDRHAHGAVMDMNGRENLMLPRSSDFRTWRGSLSARSERDESRRWFNRSEVRPGTPERTFSQFSGGNQQKIVLSRWMRTVPEVLLLEEPTQGVDVGAQQAIYGLVRDAASSGAAVLVASSDTSELVTLCDRVVVMSAGRVVAELAGERLTEAALVHLTLSPTGGKHHASTAMATEQETYS